MFHRKSQHDKLNFEIRSYNVIIQIIFVKRKKKKVALRNTLKVRTRIYLQDEEASMKDARVDKGRTKLSTLE